MLEPLKADKVDLMLVSPNGSRPNPTLSDCLMGKCDGSGILFLESGSILMESKLCKCLKVRKHKQFLGERFYNIDLNEIVPRDAKQKHLKAMLVRKPETRLFLHGSWETGKTHFLAAVYLYWSWKSDKVLYLDDKRMRDNLLDAELKGDYSYILDLVEDYNYIFIDDVGKIKMTDFHRMALYQFFNEIYKSKKHVFITSNNSPAELAKEEYWGGAIVRRVQSLCDLVEF